MRNIIRVSYISSHYVDYRFKRLIWVLGDLEMDALRSETDDPTGATAVDRALPDMRNVGYVRKETIPKPYQLSHGSNDQNQAHHVAESRSSVDSSSHGDDSVWDTLLKSITPDPQPHIDSRTHSYSYGANNNEENGVVVDEEQTPPASVDKESDGGAYEGASVERTNSNASYSAIFSGKSRKQPTDPSSWLDSSSADRAGIRGYPIDVMPIGKKEELDVDQELEDCSRSISSVADSISSAVSTGGSLGQAGVNYLVAKFTQSDPELLALYTEASQKLTQNRFVDNNRRLLKIFYLELAREEQSLSKREAVAFLRSRRRRAEISLDIFRTVIPDYEISPSSEQDRKEFSMLNAYLEGLDAAGKQTPRTRMPKITD